MRVWALHVRVCAVCMLIYVCVCVGACGSVYLSAGTSHFDFLLFCSAAAAATVSCRPYHTVPQALKLSTLWQTRTVVQQQSHSKHVWTTTYFASVDIV